MACGKQPHLLLRHFYTPHMTYTPFKMHNTGLCFSTQTINSNGVPEQLAEKYNTNLIIKTNPPKQLGLGTVQQGLNSQTMWFNLIRSLHSQEKGTKQSQSLVPDRTLERFVPLVPVVHLKSFSSSAASAFQGLRSINKRYLCYKKGAIWYFFPEDVE